MIHLKIMFIILNFTFALDTLKLKSDYFKDFNLGKLNIEAKDILTLQPLKQFAGDYNYITQSKIDSIVNNAYLYEPSPISNNDTIFIETTKGTIKLQYFTDIAPNHCYNFKKLANSGFYDNTTFP